MVDLARRNGLVWDAILGAELARDYKPKPVVYLSPRGRLRLRARPGDDGGRAFVRSGRRRGLRPAHRLHRKARRTRSRSRRASGQRHGRFQRRRPRSLAARSAAGAASSRAPPAVCMAGQWGGSSGATPAAGVDGPAGRARPGRKAHSTPTTRKAMPASVCRRRRIRHAGRRHMPARPASRRRSAGRPATAADAGWPRSSTTCAKPGRHRPIVIIRPTNSSGRGPNGIVEAGAADGDPDPEPDNRPGPAARSPGLARSPSCADCDRHGCAAIRSCGSDTRSSRQPHRSPARRRAHSVRDVDRRIGAARGAVRRR